MRIIERVSEEYIYDPDSDLYYWLAPIYKTGTEQQLLDDLEVMADYLSGVTQSGEHVFRPTAMIQRSALSSISDKVKARLSENTYLMLFDYGASEPEEIPADPWTQEGTNIFLWSSDTKVYTWCDSNDIAHRFVRSAGEAAIQCPDEYEPQNGDTTGDTIGGNVLVTQPKTYHITGKFGFFNIDVTVEGE